MLEEVTIQKLVHGGQGIGTLADGRRVFVWNALPGETVKVRLTKNKKKHAEGIAEEILKSSPEREVPRDAAYLSTSPWQIMNLGTENGYKAEILSETLEREHVNYTAPITVLGGDEEWHYRNKMEYSFWAGKPPVPSSSGLQSPNFAQNQPAARQRTKGYASSQQTDSDQKLANFASKEKAQEASDNGLHLALFNRGTHQKQIVEGSSIAIPIIDEIAQKIIDVLNQHSIRGSQLKTIVVRTSQKGEAVAALFVKDESFPKLEELQNICKGVAVYFSNPKSPASVITKELYVYGEITLTDTIRDNKITYDVNSFFQVNVGIFEKALGIIAEEVKGTSSVDMYAGVGTIGIPVGAKKLVEIDDHNITMAKLNVGTKDIAGVHASAESALEHIDHDTTLIVDPPRAGLHQKVTDRILETLPPKVVYLSCNPITQARDLALLQPSYKIKSIQGFNFFPRTPHIESLAVLIRKES